MTRLLFVALAVVVAGGCRKAMESPEPAAGGGKQGGGTGIGFVDGPKAAVNRVVTAAELHELHLMMTQEKLANGRVPTAQETIEALNRPDGNRQLAKMVRDGLIVLVPEPPEEGLWAYSKEVPEQGGWVLTHSEPQRVTAAEFARLQQRK